MVSYLYKDTENHLFILKPALSLELLRRAPSQHAGACCRREGRGWRRSLPSLAEHSPGQHSQHGTIPSQPRLQHLWIRWRWLQPLGQLACQCSTHRCYRGSSPVKGWELVSLVFSTPFPCLSAGPVPGTTPFFKACVLLLLVLILHFEEVNHHCFADLSNSRF